jgi:hypothetical protein
LDLKLLKHEKIRFRRDEISELSGFPSAEGHGHLMRRGSMRRWMLRGLAAAATLVTSLALVIGVSAYLLATTGISTEELGDEAEAALKSLTGLDVDATLGPARVSIDRSLLLAVNVPRVSLRTRREGAPLIEAGSIDFGLRPVPLLSGRIQLGSARISDARIFVGAFGSGSPSDLTASIRNSDGLIDPDLVAPVVFEAVHRLYDAFSVGSTRSIELDNVEFMLSPGMAIGGLKIDEAELAQTSGSEMRFSADLDVDGRAVAVDGSATRDPKSKRITALQLEVSADGPAGTATEGTEAPIEAAGHTPPSGIDADPRAVDVLGPVELSLTGEEDMTGMPSKLKVSGSIGRSTFAIDRRHYLEAEVDLAASITTGENKVRIEKLAIRQDRSNYVLYGPIGPRPVTDGEPPAYRFELASDDSSSAPAGSPEPAVEFSLMLAGTYDPGGGRLSLPNMDLRTSSGELQARAAIDFVAGKPPGIDLAVTVPDLSTSHFKQLWPFTAAPSARNWAMNNLFGGRVSNTKVGFRVPPGRLGNGVPLSADEVFGHVEISGARFDITGAIPPMRNAAGTVDFRGNDVDVTLASGAVYLPDGQSVSAKNGILTVRDAYKLPVIGQLEIDVAGDASSVARLASYEPIDGLSRTGMAPDEFSGAISGHVSTQIPLSGDIDTRQLNWLVSLDFKDLALTKPIEDQLVSEANGNITLDPLKAVIKTKARLNGAPAEITMIEPLRPEGPKPSRDVSMVLDDEAREEIAPGIGTLVQGPIKVSFTSGEGGSREVKADLTDARLDLPWVGWSKGPGIAADVEFSLLAKDGAARLEDFKLAGKSFAISGDITVVDGALSSAKLSSVQLNRGDDARVSIERNRKGFDIKIVGDALDARSIIKMLKETKEGGGGFGGSRPISLQAKVARLSGFHGETLSDVALSYSGTGSTVSVASFSGTTSSGAAVSMQDQTKSGMRSLEMHSADAGAVLRFMDIYEHMVGGNIKFALSGPADGTLTGQVDTSNFEVVDEPKLRSLVSSAPAGDGRSLNEAVKREIDTSRVTFERGFATIAKSDDAVQLQNGVLRGPLIGSTFQGTLYDKAGNMDMTGTFMPAYGLNRIFGELPVVGMILGNGRDRGLIGVTFRLRGDADKPTLQINPLSVIAPGIFRSIFEYR